MSELLTYQKFARIGIQTALTTPNGFVTGDKNSALATRWFDVPVMIGGLKGRGQRRKEALATEHALRGAAWIVRRERNLTPGSLAVPLLPYNAKFLLDLALAVDASGRVAPHTFQQWFNNVDLGGSGQGKQLSGCVAQALTLSIDRNASASIILNVPFFLNEDTELTGTLPLPPVAGGFVQPTLDPYDSLYALIDLVQVGSLFAGNHPDVRSVEISINQGTTVSDPRGNPSSGTRDGTWTKWRCNIPVVTLKVRMVLTDSAQLNYLRSLIDTDWTSRIGFFHPQSNFNTTSTSALLAGQTSGGTQTVTVASTTGLSLGDVVALVSDDMTSFNVATVAAPLTGTTFAVANDEIKQAMTGSPAYRIRNAAFGTFFDRLELMDVGDPEDAEGVQVVDLDFMSRLNATANQTQNYAYTAYNDDNA